MTAGCSFFSSQENEVASLIDRKFIIDLVGVHEIVKMPADALMFPNPPSPGESFSFTKLRNPRNTTKEFGRKASALGFPDLRLHDLRGTHETLLLDAGVPCARRGRSLRPRPG